MPIIELCAISHIYMEGTPLETLALHDVSCTLDSGEIVAIMGKTGAGKSTLMQHLNGILCPSRGTVLFNNENIHVSKKNVTHSVGLVFQFPEAQLFEQTVFDDIAFGPRNLGWDEDDVVAAVNEAVESIDASLMQLFERSPFTLSGGEQRKVALCGVLAMRPRYLCLDEPAAGLDPRSKEQLFATLQRLHTAGKGIIIVTHDSNDAFRYADRIIVMQNGIMVLNELTSTLRRTPDRLTEFGIAVPDTLTIARYVTELFNSQEELTEERVLMQLVAHARNKMP